MFDRRLPVTDSERLTFHPQSGSPDAAAASGVHHIRLNAEQLASYDKGMNF